MAKTSAPKGGTSKVRLIVFEAEVNDGDFSQVAQAIQNALRPTHTPTRVIHVAAPSHALSDLNTFTDDDDVFEAEEEVVPEGARTRVSRPNKPKAIKPPKVIDGIDWDSAPGIKPFTDGFDIKTVFEKYLAVALWFRDHRGTENISAAHVYTAFRHIGWPTSFPDFTKPFRNMVANQLFTGGAKDGFAINQLGEGKIREKARG